MNVDVVTLVKESLDKMGCGSAIAGELDVHSPICIDFNAMPSMYVEAEGDKVTLWATLDYAGNAQLSRAASDLLEFMLPRGSEIFVCRRPLLSLVDDSLVLHARVEDDFLADADTFMKALEAFYEDLCGVFEILER
ncbi:hypothetical protein WS62_29745 [Burkholderia sp. ABCPW 14]|uniref:InvB/SpaK family type III secretion system chaperone n=1 Tax=Burkholderia sp. ABCPW 14 TaxID=1637860 RepID=UPI000770DFED|nr:hypothetical protein [Burkholderia sp. ABCPW 14]KVD78010.1 hypothetical protein WS62_29745 [Burkholderia sp. ABCPW 14]